MSSGTLEDELRRRRHQDDKEQSSNRQKKNQQRYNNNISSQSQLLVWPRRSRNRERPGYVLGWKSTRSTTPVASNDQERATLAPQSSSTSITTVIAAGFLPLNKSLADYYQTLEKLKQHYQKQGSNKVPSKDDDEDVEEEEEEEPSPGQEVLGCCTSCLLDSLEILAVWDPTNGISKNKSIKAARHLPRITTHRRYPWWETDGEEEKSDVTMREHPPPRQQQLLYYDLDGCQSKFGHLAVEYSNLDTTTSTTQWSRMLMKLNYSPTICGMVEDGTRIPAWSPGAAKDDEGPIDSNKYNNNNNNDKSKKERREPESSITPQEQDGVCDSDATFKTSDVGWKWVQHKLFTQSFTMLHFHQLCCNTERKDKLPSKDITSTTWSLMSCLSIFRLIRVVQQRPERDRRKGENPTCVQCSKGDCRVLPSPAIEARRHVAYWDRVFFAVLDLILGLGVAWIIMSLQKEATLPTIYLQNKQVLWDMLQQNIAWLESFPGGFKLNVPLTHNMGHEIRNLVHMHQITLSTTLGNLEFLQFYLFPCLATMGAICGWSSLLALVVDIWKVEMLHITIFVVCFRALYRSELYLLAALFRLFRGRKRNVLRHRTDSMEYDVMQLLVGTICFCICIFLWTTILVYYTFFVSWNIALHVPIVSLWLIYVTTYRGAVPCGALLWWRTRHPDWFSSTVHVKELLDDGIVSIWRLVSVPESHGSVLSKSIKPHTRRFQAWLISFGLEVLFPRASTTSPSSMPLESLLHMD